jgi:CHASE2 domain-containing sensor protein
MKVLTSNRSRLVKLFEQEAQVLRHLKHKGIPQIDTYFTFLPSNSSKELRCLVMEKISGQNLAQWLEENGSISEAQAIDWLQQIVNILSLVHQEQLLHRDIKPSNIMLRADGQLVLIDFGTAREVTRTYVEKLERNDITSVYSQGYTAPEQVTGQAVLQSDFFALGRTFVHLLTGTNPDDLPKNPQTNQLIWRDIVPKVSTILADLIDDLMAELPQNRPQNTQVILARLLPNQSYGEERVAVPTNGQEQRGRTEYNSALGRFGWKHRGICRWQGSLHKVLLASVAITSLVMGVRYLGMLQSQELGAFDQLLRLRPEERSDPRLLVVAITEADIRSQKQRKGSLSDRALAQLLEKLEQYQPRAIGLDIYRDFPVAPEYRKLATRLQQNQHLIAVCKCSDPDTDPDGVPPPPEVPPERLGFSDFVEDSDDGVIRRHLLSMTPTSPCTAPYAFSVMLAFHYLQAEGITPKFTSNGDLQLGTTVFKRLQAHTGGYQQVDARGNQVMLNYRSSYSPQRIAAQVTLTQVLNNQINPNSVKDRIVLIGATGTSAADDWFTPYGAGASKKLPGVIMQAQMLSQILSAVLDRRPLLWVWSFWGEALWIWGWSIVGGILACSFRSLLKLGLAGATTLGVLYGLCFGLLLKGAWVPLVPSAITLVVTGGIVRVACRVKNPTKY